MNDCPWQNPAYRPTPHFYTCVTGQGRHASPSWSDQGSACRHLPLNRTDTAFATPAYCWTVLWRHWCMIRPESTWMAPLGAAVTLVPFLHDSRKKAVYWLLTVTLKPLLRRASWKTRALPLSKPSLPILARSHGSMTCMDGCRVSCWISACHRHSWMIPSGASVFCAMVRWTCAWTRPRG